MENNEDYNKLYKFCLKLIDLLEEYKYDLSSCGCCDGFGLINTMKKTKDIRRIQIMYVWKS